MCVTSVQELFTHSGAVYAGAVKWGSEVPLTKPGVYVVSTTQNPDDANGLEACPLDAGSVAALLERHPGAMINGQVTDLLNLVERLQLMWPVGEPVVYIGLAGGSVRARVAQFYSTPIGARAPHAGGWPVKMLEPQRLWVHYGQTMNPDAAETTMVDYFVHGIPAEARQALVDPDAPLPFANLRFPAGRKKRHGLDGVKTTRSKPQPPVSTRPRIPQPPQASVAPLERTNPMSPAAERRRTQNVTDADLRGGRIRIPRSAKSVLPAEKTRIRIVIGGEAATVLWDPRTSGAQERSGVIRVGRNLLTRHVVAGDPREIECMSDGSFLVS
ncbi:conserved hypothetical protein [Pseudoclavibacter sp. 8L]|nr:conserved hypothetical protein [Pseudoclavibacter sp. 8L]